MHEFVGDGDREDPGSPGWDLDGGPLIPGVDYEGAWLTARAASDALNAMFVALGLPSCMMRAQAGWASDGAGVVHLEGTPLGARRLAGLLERMMERGQPPERA